MTATLLETLKTQQDQGKRSDTGWKSKAWTVARDAVILASQKKANPSIPQVKSKIDNFAWVLCIRSLGSSLGAPPEVL